MNVHSVQCGVRGALTPRPLTMQPLGKAAMATQKCTRCGVDKPLSAFSTNGAGKLKRRCKQCRTEVESARWQSLPLEKRKAGMSRISAWVQRNPDKYRRYKSKWVAENIEHLRLKVQLRRRRYRAATPAWANKDAIKAIYKLAAELTRSTGVRHEVDHIVPLTSAIVCGLHCEANLQVLPELENKRKNNLVWPDMP